LLLNYPATVFKGNSCL